MEMITADGIQTGLIIIVLAYLAGSIPFGLVLTRLAGKGDIRDIGSGNIGATNVLRTGSKPLAGLTLLLDAGKGAGITLLLAAYVSPDPVSGEFSRNVAAALAGCAVVIGHCFPVWLRFRGGKGVATSLAVFAAFDWRIGLLFCLVWLGTAAITRYSSLAALVASLACTMVAFLMGSDPAIAIAILLMSGLTWVRHHQNIGRLLNGTESKIGSK
jgi:glycerol-3-phosphate acyltransferase PlsY